MGGGEWEGKEGRGVRQPAWHARRHTRRHNRGLCSNPGGNPFSAHARTWRMRSACRGRSSISTVTSLTCAVCVCVCVCVCL